MRTQPRQPRGTPVGGQFASHTANESTLILDEPSEFKEEMAARRDTLARRGYVPPKALNSTIDPHTTAHRTEWWDRAFAIAEYGNKKGDYAQMPDDFTPSGGSGSAISGHRRTHRMAYQGSGVVMRMPSVTSIKRYESEVGGTFDVPVTATYPGGDVAGWVRVTRTDDGSWATRGLGFPPEASAYVAESVQCVLESRRPSRALSEVGDLLERRRQRAARLGIKMQTVATSSWVRATGYDSASSTMVMSTSSAANYGYTVPISVYKELSEGKAPGRVFNTLVKGRAPRIEVVQCPNCQRFYGSGNDHRCQPHETKRSRKRLPVNSMHRKSALSRFLGRFRR